MTNANICMYKEKGSNRFENDNAIVGIRKNKGKYIVSLIEKNTNTLIVKEYHKKSSINNLTEKYGIIVK